VPHHAETTVAAVVCVLVLTVDLRGAIGLSAFGVLLYYLVANLAAFTQDRAHRRYPRAFQLLGAVGCCALVVAVPVTSLVGGVVVLVVGIGYRLTRSRRQGK
jgi:APA family basic amino acid/polyamine antiporter